MAKHTYFFSAHVPAGQVTPRSVIAVADGRMAPRRSREAAMRDAIGVVD
jgi:hypothetical protein